MLYEKVVSGLTLEDRLRADRKQGLVMGKRYYEVVRDMYCSEEAPLKRLRVANEGEELWPPAENALLQLLGKERDPTPLKELFDNGEAPPNQKTLVVLMRQMTKVPAVHPPKNTQLHLSLMAWMSKHKLDTIYPNEFQTARAQFDTVLSKSFSAYKNSDLSAKLWWQGHSHIGKC